MRDYSIGVNVLYDTASLSLEEGPAWRFALEALFGALGRIGHLVGDGVRFPKSSWLGREWGTLGQLWCGKVCMVFDPWLYRALHVGSHEMTIAEAWALTAAMPAERRWLAAQVLTALDSTPVEYARARGTKGPTVIADLEVRISPERVDLPGASFVPCGACAGSALSEPGSACMACAAWTEDEREERECSVCGDRRWTGEVACPECVLVRLTYADSWNETILTPEDARNVPDQRIRRYADTKDLMREVFSSGWVRAAD